MATETEKMRKLESKLESLCEELEEIASELEQIDRDKLDAEWEQNPEDGGYSSDAPEEFVEAIRYAIEAIGNRYDNL